MNIKKLFASMLAIGFMSTIAQAQEKPVVVPATTTSAKVGKIENTLGIPAAMPMRVSKILGMKIQNSKKENVGQIQDIVIDPSSTRVQYVAVTYGGFLGLGDKLFAVPMHAIKVQQDPDHKDHVLLVLDVTKEQMKGATGFDEENWPNFADKDISSELHRRYGVMDRWNDELIREGKVDVRVDRAGVTVGVDGVKK